jgi:hypothetical protein
MKSPFGLTIAAIALLTAFAFGGCKKTNTNSNCLIAGVSEDNITWSEYQYDNQNRIIKYTVAPSGDYYTFDYSQSLLQMDYYSMGVRKVHTTIYRNSMGYATMRIDTSLDSTSSIRVDTAIYRYDAAGHNVSFTMFPNSLGIQIDSMLYTGDNMTFLTIYNIGTGSVTIPYSYTNIVAKSFPFPMLDVDPWLGTFVLPPYAKNLPDLIAADYKCYYKLDENGYVLQVAAVNVLDNTDTLLNNHYRYTCP